MMERTIAAKNDKMKRNKANQVPYQSTMQKLNSSSLKDNSTKTNCTKQASKAANRKNDKTSQPTYASKISATRHKHTEEESKSKSFSSVKSSSKVNSYVMSTSFSNKSNVKSNFKSAKAKFNSNVSQANSQLNNSNVTSTVFIYVNSVKGLILHRGIL